MLKFEKNGWKVLLRSENDLYLNVHKCLRQNPETNWKKLSAINEKQKGWAKFSWAFK